MIDPDLLNRFRAAIDRLLPDRTTPIGLAVSGGPDSLALVLLARAAGLPIAAATVDHGLRPEAAAEADYVAQICAELGVRHQILRLTHPPTGNVQAWARRERYAALSRWQADGHLPYLATAHHADDQLETMLMRLNRGAGVGGLAGIRAARGAILRPLLDWRKAELEALVAKAGLTPVADPSNSDDRFDRARLRKALRDAPWLDAQAAARSARALASADEALDWAATQALAARLTAPRAGQVHLDPQDLPFELLRRMVRACLIRVQPEAAPRDDELLRLLRTLQDGRTATLAGVKCSGGPVWSFAKAPAARPVARNS